MDRLNFIPQRGMILDCDLSERMYNLNPVKGSETGKIRPCIVVTNNIYNRILSVIQVVPITEWTEKKALVKTNITLLKSSENGLTKKSIADCLQNRPIDYKQRFIRLRGKLSSKKMSEINQALRIIFDI